MVIHITANAEEIADLIIGLRERRRKNEVDLRELERKINEFQVSPKIKLSNR